MSNQITNSKHTKDVTNSQEDTKHELSILVLVTECHKVLAATCRLPSIRLISKLREEMSVAVHLHLLNTENIEGEFQPNKTFNLSIVSQHYFIPHPFL